MITVTVECSELCTWTTCEARLDDMFLKGYNPGMRDAAIIELVSTLASRWAAHVVASPSFHVKPTMTLTMDTVA